MSTRTDLTEIGTTFGLSSQTCNKATFAAEQCYVYLDTETAPSHPVLVEGWVGYEIPSKLRMTKRQATELIALLAQAVARL